MNDPRTPAMAGQPSSRQSGFLDKLRQRLRRGGDEQSLRSSLEHAIDEHDEASPVRDDLGDEEVLMLRNLLSSGRLRLDEVMVPRVDIVAFDIDDDFAALVALFNEAAHSRVPVYRGTLDDVIGMVHIKDVMRQMVAGGAPKGPEPKGVVQSLLRSVLFVPPSMRVIDLLVKMRLSRTHMAVVVDEYGGTDGLLTIEDMIEQVVGDIEDEHDDLATDPIRPLDGGGFDVDARVEIEEMEKALGFGLLPTDHDEDFDTLGGLVVSLAGRVPVIGETIEHPSGLRFEIVDGDPRRLKRLRIHLAPGRTAEVER